VSITRREFLNLLGFALLSSIGLPVGGYQYASRIEANWLALKRVNIPLKALNPALQGLKIVQLSDIHLRPFTQIELVEKAVEMVNQLEADIVVFTGDYVLESADAIFELAPVLAKIQARHGRFAILGNHDLWTNAQLVKKGLEENGIPVLINEGVNLSLEAGSLFLAGLDDGWSSIPDLDLALQDCPANTPVILLMHEPDFFDEFARDPRVSLQLSGHTHGGQVRLPGIGGFVLPKYGKKYPHGLYQKGETWLYVNRGLGVISPPVRFNCRPEITEITLSTA
jgi:uncharacterized protein